MGRSESIWDFENGDRLAPDFLARLQRVFAADFLLLIAPHRERWTAAFLIAAGGDVKVVARFDQLLPRPCDFLLLASSVPSRPRGRSGSTSVHGWRCLRPGWRRAGRPARRRDRRHLAKHLLARQPPRNCPPSAGFCGIAGALTVSAKHQFVSERCHAGKIDALALG
ncbi:MAG: hypothetical protein WBL40_22825, partial [Terrimicrobiaceae bacterium]